MNNDLIVLQDTLEVEAPDVITTKDVTTSSKVILFNDEWHSFEEVIEQIRKAVGCTQKRAESLTWEVHTKGKACVYSGDMPGCLKVSGVLEEIGLHTQVEC